jgi:hypothetical protein
VYSVIFKDRRGLPNYGTDIKERITRAPWQTIEAASMDVLTGVFGFRLLDGPGAIFHDHAAHSPDARAWRNICL